MRLPWWRNSSCEQQFQPAFLDRLPYRFWTCLTSPYNYVSLFLAINLLIYIFYWFSFSGWTLTDTSFKVFSPSSLGGPHFIDKVRRYSPNSFICSLRWKMNFSKYFRGPSLLLIGRKPFFRFQERFPSIRNNVLGLSYWLIGWCQITVNCIKKKVKITEQKKVRVGKVWNKYLCVHTDINK